MILKIISELIKYINKDDIIFLLEYFWKFYDKNKLDENNYPFMSLEYLEDKINKYFEFYYFKNIYKEKEDNNKSFYSLFHFLIKDNFLEININQEYINKYYKTSLINPINETINNYNDNIKNIYTEYYNLTNLSFYKCDSAYINEIFNDNSILFTKSISNNNDLQELSNILENNINKIKVIIVNEINNNINQNDLIDFINKYLIPIYKLENDIYKILIGFFIQGNGVHYINIYNDNNSINDKYNIFNIYKLNLDNTNNDEESNPIKALIQTKYKNKLNKIINNPLYKTKICYKFRDYYNCRNPNCNFAHGNEELRDIKNIR